MYTTPKGCTVGQTCVEVGVLGGAGRRYKSGHDKNNYNLPTINSCEKTIGCYGFAPVCRLEQNRLCLCEVYASYTYGEMVLGTNFFAPKMHRFSRKPTHEVTSVKIVLPYH